MRMQKDLTVKKTNYPNNQIDEDRSLYKQEVLKIIADCEQFSSPPLLLASSSSTPFLTASPLQLTCSRLPPFLLASSRRPPLLLASSHLLPLLLASSRHPLLLLASSQPPSLLLASCWLPPLLVASFFLRISSGCFFNFLFLRFLCLADSCSSFPWPSWVTAVLSS